MHATVHWKSGVAVLLAVLRLLAYHSATGFAEEGAGMPPGKSLGDHRCIHDKVRICAQTKWHHLNAFHARDNRLRLPLTPQRGGRSLKRVLRGGNFVSHIYGVFFGKML